MVQTADVVVVGGGVNGTSIAYALASKGARCVLVEKNAVAWGASGRSSALVRMITKPVFRLPTPSARRCS
jgi:sarcosine oxidase subunit beta